MFRLFLIPFLFFGSVVAKAQPHDAFDFEVQDAGRAWTWDDARASCEALGAGWDLPIMNQFFYLAMTNRATRIQFTDKTLYASWVRGENEEENLQYRGTNKIVYVSEGTGYETEFLKVSQVQFASYQKQLEGVLLYPPSLQRSDQEQQYIKIAYATYQMLYKDKAYQIDVNETYDLEEMKVLPDTIFTPKIKESLTRVRHSYIQEVIDSHKPVVEAFTGGFLVRCAR